MSVSSLHIEEAFVSMGSQKTRLQLIISMQWLSNGPIPPGEKTDFKIAKRP